LPPPTITGNAYTQKLVDQVQQGGCQLGAAELEGAVGFLLEARHSGHGVLATDDRDLFGDGLEGVGEDVSRCVL
jgi:hypothetical protein